MAKLSLLLLAASLTSTTLSQSLGPISRTVLLPTPTCGPTAVTAIHTTTYTYRHRVITSTIAEVTHVPHSCYTSTAIASIAYCPLFNSATCGVHPDCIIIKTETVPCRDACCPSTPTVTVAHCPTCQTGCATAVETVTCKER